MCTHTRTHAHTQTSYLQNNSDKRLLLRTTMSVYYAHRDRNGVVCGKFEHEFAAGFLLRLVERPDAADHLDIALVRRRHSFTGLASARRSLKPPQH